MCKQQQTKYLHTYSIHIQTLYPSIVYVFTENNFSREQNNFYHSPCFIIYLVGIYFYSLEFIKHNLIIKKLNYLQPKHIRVD
jgi:hypothetical protein